MDSVFAGASLPLKPCPHCGCAAWMDTRKYVRCEDQKDCANETQLFNTYQEAADWWNRRAENKRPYPDLLSDEEKAALLKRAENLWSDLQKNDLGGFSGINRPFWILHEFKDIIERFGGRDVGLHWSHNDLKRLRPRETDNGR